ncbi:hypothetical protein JOM56_002806 [Amanita muscaria]
MLEAQVSGMIADLNQQKKKYEEVQASQAITYNQNANNLYRPGHQLAYGGQGLFEAQISSWMADLKEKSEAQLVQALQASTYNQNANNLYRPGRQLAHGGQGLSEAQISGWMADQKEKSEAQLVQALQASTYNQNANNLYYPEHQLAQDAYGGQGLVAVALYDYEAKQDDEMNLVEGERIEQIAKHEDDEIWWYGVGPGGKSGLFPCKHDLTKILSFPYWIWRHSQLR